MKRVHRIFAGVLLMGQTLGTAALAGEGGSSSAGVPNPASAWCDVNGGELQFFESAQGTHGICRLEHAQVEEWTFYRATGSNGTTQATQAFITHLPFRRPVSRRMPLPNPVSGYCRYVGGELLVLNSATVGPVGFCKFSDGSIIEEWTLFRGPDSEGYRQLGKLLGQHRRP